MIIAVNFPNEEIGKKKPEKKKIKALMRFERYRCDATYWERSQDE